MAQILKLGVALIALASLASTVASIIVPGVYSWWGGMVRVSLVLCAVAVCVALLSWAVK